MSDSILTQEFIDQALSVAQKNLKADGEMTPVIFLRFANKVVHVMGVMLPETPIERRRLMSDLRQQFQKQGQLNEAVMVMDSWYVASTDAADGLRTAPSQHPRRQQAILVVGRNAKNSRMSLMVQPYQNDKSGCLVWNKPVIAHYNQPTDDEKQVEGLLDDLFVPQCSH